MRRNDRSSGRGKPGALAAGTKPKRTVLILCQAIGAIIIVSVGLCCERASGEWSATRVHVSPDGSAFAWLAEERRSVPWGPERVDVSEKLWLCWHKLTSWTSHAL